MNKYTLQNDLTVFGMQVKTFPTGIGETFDALVKMLPGGFDRSFYGISYRSKEGAMIYIAAAEEKYKDEAEKYNCERYRIEKGEYLTETVLDWREKTNSLNEVFHGMMKDNRVDRTKPVIEWYKDDKEMMCMVKSVITG